MSKLRTKDGVPVASDFAGHEPPLVEDFSTGVLYTINEADSVQPIGGIGITAAETSAGVTPTNYYYEPGNVLRYGTNTAPGTTDMTAAIQAALNVGGTVFFPGGTYAAAGLTCSTDGQRLISLGNVTIRKNANGAIITISAHDAELSGLLFTGVSASFTGDSVVSSGNRTAFINCGSDDAEGRALRATGQQVKITGQRSVYRTADASATGYDIEIGVSGTATLYHQLQNIYTSQTTGGIVLIDTGSASIVASQFGKLFVDSGTNPAGVNGGVYVGNRITGAVVVEVSDALFAANQFASTITLGASTSGIRIDESNSHAGGVPSITNNGNADNYWAYSTSTALRHSRGVAIRNAASVELEGTSVGTDGVLVMSTADNLSITNEVTAKGIILTQTGAGTINLDINGARSFQADSNNTAGNTRFLIYDVDNATLERVSVGAADSGGAGFKVLRIAN